jgi:hypothetical protein
MKANNHPTIVKPINNKPFGLINIFGKSITSIRLCSTTFTSCDILNENVELKSFYWACHFLYSNHHFWLYFCDSFGRGGSCVGDHSLVFE